MEPTKLENELLRYMKGLSKESLLEVLDFVQFIRLKKMKRSVDNLTKELYALNSSETEHLDEEFKDYKQLYPNE